MHVRNQLRIDAVSPDDEKPQVARRCVELGSYLLLVDFVAGKEWSDIDRRNASTHEKLHSLP